MHIELRLNPAGYIEYRVVGGFNHASCQWKPSRDMAPVDKLVADTGMEIVTREYWESMKGTKGMKPPKKKG